jgi:hypothetical protein
MQLHAERLQIPHCRRVLRVPAQQPHGFESQPLARRRQRVQVIGMRTAKADDALGAGTLGGFEMFNEFEPLVATDQWVDAVQAQDRDLDAGVCQPA